MLFPTRADDNRPVDISGEETAALRLRSGPLRTIKLTRRRKPERSRGTRRSAGCRRSGAAICCAACLTISGAMLILRTLGYGFFTQFRVAENNTPAITLVFLQLLDEHLFNIVAET